MLSCPGWPQTCNPPALVSQVAEITGMSPYAWQSKQPLEIFTSFLSPKAPYCSSWLPAVMPNFEHAGPTCVQGCCWSKGLVIPAELL